MATVHTALPLFDPHIYIYTLCPNIDSIGSYAAHSLTYPLLTHQQTVVSPPSPPHPHIDVPDEVLMMMLFLSHHIMKMRSHLQAHLRRSRLTPQPKKVSECSTDMERDSE